MSEEILEEIYKESRLFYDFVNDIMGGRLSRNIFDELLKAANRHHKAMQALFEILPEAIDAEQRASFYD